MNIASGKEMFSRLDLVVNGLYPIEIKRYYDSQSDYDSPLGYGWGLSWDIRVFEYADEDIIVRHASGQRTEYVPTTTMPDGSKLYSAGVMSYATLTRETDGTYTLDYPRGRTYRFNALGLLVTAVNAEGNGLQFLYDPCGLCDQPGEAFSRYDLTGTSPNAIDPAQRMTVANAYRLQRIQEFGVDTGITGRGVDFHYCQTGRLDYIEATAATGGGTDGRRVSFRHGPDAASASYCHANPDGNLYAVDILSDAAETITESYDYEPVTHNITHRQYAPGMVVYYNEYDGRDRVVVEEWQDPAVNPTDDTDARPNTRFEFAYNDNPDGSPSGVTTVTRAIYSPTYDPGVSTLAGRRTYVSTYEYNPAGYLTRVVDARGMEWKYESGDGTVGGNYVGRDSFANRITISEPDGAGGFNAVRQIYYQFDSVSNLKSHRIVRDVGTNEQIVTTYVYDDGWLTSTRTYYAQDVGNEDKKFGVDYEFERVGGSPSGKIIGISKIKRVTSATTTEDTTLTRGTDNQVTRITTPLVDPTDGVVVLEYYDLASGMPGRLKRAYLEGDDPSSPGTPIELLETEMELHYDARGFVDWVEDKKDQRTAFARDWLGRARTITLADASGAGSYDQIHIEYGAPKWDALTPVTDPAATASGYLLTKITRDPADASDPDRADGWIYDYRGRLRSVVRSTDGTGAGGTWSEFAALEYDSDGNAEQVDVDGAQWLREFDERRNLLATIDPDLNRTDFGYDAFGNREYVKNARGGETLITFDALDRATRIDEVSALGSETLSTELSYDAAGNVRTVQDPKTETTTYIYDLRSRLTTVQRPLVDGAIPETEYQYDARGRLTRTINARDEVLTYSYHPFGGVREVNRFPDVAAADAGTNPTRTVTYTYDANGNVATVTDSAISTGASPLYAYTYDARDRAVRSTAHHLVAGGGTPRTFVHTYAIDDAPRSLALHSAAIPTPADLLETTTWAYDPSGLLDTIDFPGGAATDLDYGYYANDLLESLSRPASGVSTAFAQFASGPVQQITVSNTSAELHDLLYPSSTGYDANWNVTRIDESVDGTPVASPATYGYDGFDRLTDPSLPGLYGQTTSESWAYDDAGNRDETASPGSFAYDSNDRLRTLPGKTYHYDPDGNPTEIRDGADTTVLATLIWDETNRLSSYTEPATGAVTTFVYDPFGRRVEKTHDPDGPGEISPTTTRYLWNGDQLYGEYQGGTRTVRYGYGGGFMPVQVAYGSEASETVYDVHGDHLGTPRMLTDASGSVVWRAAYDAYGEAYVDPAGTLGQAFNVRFPGQYFDAETGLHYNRFRYYDPSIGRYISADPLGQHVDPNLYAYVGNSPTNAIDPLGLYTWSDARSDAAFFARNSAQGLAAAADGAIPFFDPFAGAGAYDPCDPTLAGSRTAGAATAAALAALAGYGAANGFGALSGAGLADAVATAVGAGASESFGTDDVPAGSYDQPNGDRTDIRQQEDHGAGVTHTHEQTYNTAPSGERFPAGRTQPGRPVSSRDANNIRSGRATRSSPRGR